MSNILFIQTSYTAHGGIENWSKGLASYFRAQGHQCSFLCAYEETFTDPENPVFGLNEKSSANIFVKMGKLFTRAKAIVRHIKEHKPDILIVSVDNMITSTAFALSYLKPEERPKSFAVIHQQLSTSTKLNQILIRPALTKSTWNKIITVSKGMEEDTRIWIGPQTDPIQTICNFTNIERNQARQHEGQPTDMPQGNHVAVTAGRLAPVKGFDRLIDSWSEVVKIIPDAKLCILGEGVEKEKLTEKIKALSLENNVSMPGSKPNVFPYMKYSRFYICSSHFESFALAILDAMSIGKPVISIDCDFGPREILEGPAKIETYPYTTKYGYLVKQDTLAEGIINMFNQKDTFAEVDIVARAGAYDISHIGKEWLGVL